MTPTPSPVSGRSAVARPPRIPKSPPPQVVESPQIEALRAAVHAAPSADAVAGLMHAFWAGAERTGTPLVELQPDGQRAVTFLWRDRHGAGEGTRTVALLANKLTDPSVWAESQLARLVDTDLWHRTYRLPADWHGSYQLAPDDGPEPAALADGPQHGPRVRWAGLATRAVPDPLCRTHLDGKPGEPDLSVGDAGDPPPQPWRDRRPGVPRGSLRETAVAFRGAARRCWIYEPAADLATGAPTAPCDLLVLLDGEDWAGRLDLAATLDNLHADGAIGPTAALLVDAVDTPTRWQDLSCDPAFGAFLTDELLPWARREVPSTAGGRALLSGRSLGGLTALWVALRSPRAFDVIHAQSPSLWWPAETEPQGDRAAGWLGRALAAAPEGALPAEIRVEVGRQEWMLLGPARELVAELHGRGGTDVHVELAEYEGGHDAWCWRGGLARALVAASERQSRGEPAA